MNKNYYTLMFFLVLTFSVNSFSQENENTDTMEEKKKANAVKKYTEEELEKEVRKRVERQIKLLKKGSLVEISKELLKKDLALEEKEKQVNQLQKQLKTNEEYFEKRVIETEKRYTKILGCLDANKKDAEKRISHMVNILSIMKPVKAADVLSVQNPQVAIKVLSKMEPQKASKIFNLMDKEISARLQKQYIDMQK